MKSKLIFMNKPLFVFIAISYLIVSCGTSKKTTSNDLATANVIQTHLDLTAVDNDRVPVVIDPGRFAIDTVVFRLPKVVQGTYAISDFGSFIDEFKALDYSGNELST